jgi:hypothetical protein
MSRSMLPQYRHWTYPELRSRRFVSTALLRAVRQHKHINPTLVGVLQDE